MIYENTVTIQGRVCGQPQVMRSQNGNSEWTVIYIGIPQKDNKTQVIDIQVWKDELQSIARGLQKGECVRVNGMVSTRTYTDRAGQKRITDSIRATFIKLDDEHKQTQQTAQQYGMNAGPSQEITPDKLPF